MSELMNGLKKALASFHERLSKKEKARNSLIGLAREVVRDSAKAVRLMHLSPFFSEASDLIDQAKKKNHEIVEILKVYPELINSAQDAQKELTEALVFLYVLTGSTDPNFDIFAPGTLEIEVAPYLHGLADAIGELRRRMLNCMKDEMMGFAEEAFQCMEFIHNALCEFTHYPDAITNSIRVEVDRTRGIIEKSRGELAIAVLQEKLRKELEKK